MRTLLEWIAAAFIVGVLVASLAGCTNTPFTSCTEAREAGAPLPLHQGDPGWNPALDTNSDGAAC
jgi:uncharacterized membrane protein YraQ (UPF0718 family)